MNYVHPTNQPEAPASTTLLGIWACGFTSTQRTQHLRRAGGRCHHRSPPDDSDSKGTTFSHQLGIDPPHDSLSVEGIFIDSHSQPLVVTVAVVVVILEEEVLVCAVGSESDSSDAQAGEKTLKTVPPREGASVPPGLTKFHQH